MRLRAKDPVIIDNINGEYVLVNSSDKTINGPFTRYCPEDPDNDLRKSTLDLVIVSKRLFEYVDKLEIDKNLKWTPFRTTKKGILKFTDHYSLLLVFKGLPKKKKKVIGKRKITIWNMKKQRSWDKYF